MPLCCVAVNPKPNIKLLHYKYTCVSYVKIQTRVKKYMVTYIIFNFLVLIALKKIFDMF